MVCAPCRSDGRKTTATGQAAVPSGTDPLVGPVHERTAFRWFPDSFGFHLARYFHSAGPLSGADLSDIVVSRTRCSPTDCHRPPILHAVPPSVAGCPSELCCRLNFVITDYAAQRPTACNGWLRLFAVPVAVVNRTVCRKWTNFRSRPAGTCQDGTSARRPKPNAEFCIPHRSSGSRFVSADSMP